jgi:RNA polymerase subunit RPABC4/transcription elongation factor Spt4
MKENTCKNCSTILIEGQKYCAQCGQKTEIHRIDFHFIWHEIVHAVVHADKSIFHLTKDMLFEPGVVVKNYISGKRKRYFNPFSYFVIGVAFMAVLTSVFHLMEYTGPNKSTEITTKNFNKILFMSIPLSSFFSWLFFKKSGYNFWENMVFQIFLGGFRPFYFILFALGVILFREQYFYILTGYSILGVIYHIYASKQFYGENWIWTIVKCIMITILTQMIIALLIFLGLHFFNTI